MKKLRHESKPLNWGPKRGAQKLLKIFEKLTDRLFIHRRRP